jgi:ribosomal protein S18 acetylase RimI-like enzyme
VVGDARLVERPDGRRFLVAPGPEAFAERLAALLEGATGDVFVEVHESAGERLAVLAAHGFAVHRREHLYSVPVTPLRATLPHGYAAVSAADADLDRLRHLDEALRHDVPGSRGWRNDPETFERYVTGDPEFDAATYLVAVAPSGAYAGLVRVWIAPGLARLGLIGVLPAHRRRGLAAALIGRVFAVLHARGVGAVTCEVDETNVASNTLMLGLGATRTGGVIELVRRGQPVG